ncbi:hypothetical protein F5146DRAFT_1228745 [Armillaria mellea]|nr:hypothetical protein F5146DRAFT_1228745 [Armillaria mellea]
MAHHTLQASHSHQSAPYPNYDDYRSFPSYSEGTDLQLEADTLRETRFMSINLVSHTYSPFATHIQEFPVNANPYRPLYETRVIDLHQDMLDLLEHHKTEVFASIASLTHAVHRQTNYYRFAGEGIPFEIIPFANGSMPNELPHLLPALTNVHVVNALTPEQLVSYCSGYKIAHHPQNIELMVVDLKAYIGCEP